MIPLISEYPNNSKFQRLMNSPPCMYIMINIMSYCNYNIHMVLSILLIKPYDDIKVGFTYLGYKRRQQFILTIY